MQNHDGTITLEQQPTISQSDKLLFCLFLAVIFHALLLFGVVFKVPDLSKNKLNKSFNVVLAQFEAKDKVEKADFIGQVDQEAGGESEELLAPSAIEKAQFNDPNKTSSELQIRAQPKQAKNNSPQFITSNKPGENSSTPNEMSKELQQSVLDTASLIEKSYQLSGLIANLDNEQVSQAKKAKKRQISAAIHRSTDALYLDSWRRKIELIGNQNYPEKAKLEKIYGNLTLKVAINKNGTIHQVIVMNSSGSKLLDDAAIRIVRLAAPFNPLSEEMKKDTDILEIIRIWRFQEDNLVRAG
ncbi:MAG: protein TonB [Polaribacter sp.]|jgi:protein TonB